MKQENIIDGIARLRRQSLCLTPGLQIVGPGHLPQFYEKALQDHSFLECRFNENGYLSALVMIYRFRDKFFGRDNEFHFFHYDLGDRGAFEWMTELLGTKVPPLTTNAGAVVSRCYTELWPALRTKGFGIESLGLSGSPQVALDSIHAGGKGDLKTLQDLGLELVEFTDPENIPEIAKLRSQVFSDHPEFCIFYHNPGVEEQFNEFTRDRLSAGAQWELRKDSRLVGFFGFGILEDRLFGKTANMDFAMLKDFHGKNLGWLAYRVMLERMIEQDIAIFKGGTSNPAVIHMGQKMHRSLMNMTLMHQSLTPSLERYTPYLPNA